MKSDKNKKYSKSLAGFTQTNFSPNNCGKLKYDGTALNVGDGKEYKFSKNSRGFTPTPNLALFRFFNKFYLYFKFLIRNKNQNIFASAKQKALPKLVSGFTVIETLVAITILLISIIGPMEIAAKGLFSAKYAKDEITASYLAQEGIEYIRSYRDSLYLNYAFGAVNNEWFEGLDNCLSPDNKCKVDSKNSVLNAVPELCQNGDCGYLNYDGGSGIYSYDSGTASKFKREISVTKDLNNEYVLVEVGVFWNPGGIFSSNKSIILRENFTNWQRKQ